MDMQQLADAIAELTYQVADMKRRQSNFIRPGVVKSFDPKANAAICDFGFESHAVPLHNHAGAGKYWHPMTAGQQITAICPDGDIANAILLPGGFHDANPAPSQSAGEDIVAQRGSARLRTTDGNAFVEAGGSSVTVVDGVITLKAGKIVLEGKCFLGGADAANGVAMLGSIDSAGDVEASNLATMAFTK